MTSIRLGRRRWALLLVAACAGALAIGSVSLRADDRGADDPAVDGQVVEVDVRAPSHKPTVKAAATKPTEAGATAFALFWFDALNYSLARLDTELLASHTGVGCRQCSGWLIGIARWKSSQARLEGGLTVPLDLAVGPFSTTEPVTFAATFLTTPATLTQAGRSPESYPGGRTRGGFTVLWTTDRWQMTDIILDTTQAG